MAISSPRPRRAATRIEQEIRSAKDAVVDAEGDLVGTPSEINLAARAEKTTISDALRNAVLQLRVVRAHLLMLEMPERAQRR